MSVIFCVGLMKLAAPQLEWKKPWDSHTQAIQAELDNLAAAAYQHYIRPARVGGGNGAFDGSKGGTTWRIPETRDTTDYAYYMIRSISAEQIVLVGIARRGEWKGEGDDSEFRNANGQTGMIQLTLTYNPNRRDTTAYGWTTKNAMVMRKDN